MCLCQISLMSLSLKSKTLLMRVLLFVFVHIIVCDGILVQNRSVWEVRQYINSLGVEAPNAATAGELPFLVIILDERMVMCNGVIVTYEFVLASAICMQPEFYIKNNKYISQINVLSGVRDTTDPKIGEFVWSEAKDIMCDSATNPHLMLIQLREGLTLTGLINGIGLPVAPFVGNHTCFAAGYIFTSKLQPIYHRKQTVDIYDPETCKELFNFTNSSAIENSICVLSNLAVYNDTMDWDCEADDGRIVFCEKTLIGFVRKAIDSRCTNETPFMFLDVGRFYDFFEREMVFDDNKLFLGERSRFGMIHRFSMASDSTTSNYSYDACFVFLLVLYCFKM